MHKMEELRDMLCEELEKLTKAGNLSAGSLDAVDKLTHSIKSIDTILAMEDAGYSNDYVDRYSGARRRDSMGRYSRDGYSYADRRGGRYSRDDYAAELKKELEDLKMNADDEHKHMISKWIKQLED